MSAAVKYRLQAYSAKYQDVYRVDILEEDYAGAIQFKNIGAGKIVLSKSEGVIQKTTLEISIQSDTNFEFTGFMQYDNRKYPVKLYKNDVLIWQGYHVAESYSEPYQNPPYDVTIIATDNLGLLKNYEWGDLALTGFISRMDAIVAILGNTGLSLGYSIAIDFFEDSMDTSLATLEQSSFDAEIFEDEDCEHVLEQMLPFGTIITQHNNRWLIRRPLDDSEKTHLLYTYAGVYEGTETGETLLTMGDYVTAGVWPHGTPLLELEHAWKDAIIIKDYGKKESFLENYNFIDGSENWTDVTNGNFLIKKIDTVYYAQLTGNAAEGSDHYIEQGFDVVSSSDNFIFECKFDALGRKTGSTTILGDRSITLTVKFQVKIGSYYLTTSGWTTTPSKIEVEVSSSILLPNWKTLRVIAAGIPTSGTMIVRFYRIEHNVSPTLNHAVSGSVITEIKAYTDTLAVYPSPQKYRVNIREGAVGGKNEILLKPVDLPVVDNANLYYENANYVGSEYTGLWSHNGGTAKAIEQALAEQLAQYYNKPRHKISGCDWRGNGLSLNAIAQHTNNNNRKFTVTSGTWNILTDTFNVVWVETAGTGTATASDHSGETPAGTAAGTGVSNPTDSHPPVTIATGSEAYLSIDDDQVLSFTPEDYSWFLHTPEQVIDTLDEPSGFQETVDGGNAVIEQIAANTYTVTALNANGETTGAGTPFYLLDIHEDTTQALFEWTAVPGATGYRVYKAGQYMETTNTYFDHLTWTADGTGTPPAENTAVLFQNQYEIEKSDVVEFKGVYIDVETTGEGATKTVTFTGHPEVTIASGSSAFLSITDEQVLSLDLPSGFVQSDWNQTNDEAADFIKNKPTIPTVNTDYLKDWIEFEFRDVEAGTTGEYVLDIKALISYDIDSAVFQVDDGSLTDVSVKINGSSATGLNSISATTTITETAATGVVAAGNLVTLTVGSTYTGTPTLIRGKLNLTRT